MVWRWAAASQVGTSHLRAQTRKQDAFRCFLAGDTKAFCAIVCDGAGSAPFGGEGASLIARTFTVGLRDHFRTSSVLPGDEDVWGWIDSVRDKLAEAAAMRSTVRRDMASTLVLLVATNSDALVVHVGDGAVVVRETDGPWRALSWPENGEYASTTYFLTEDPAPRVRISRHAADFDAAAIFTDGIETLALDLAGGVPHEPFFQSMIAPLDTAQAEGKDRSLSDALGRFLSGPRVCERTDDDKSFIIASVK
jgi:hypothetical protein